jgi:hypothetical protein
VRGPGATGGVAGPGKVLSSSDGGTYLLPSTRSIAGFSSTEINRMTEINELDVDNLINRNRSARPQARRMNSRLGQRNVRLRGR